MPTHAGLEVTTIENGPFQENCFIAADPASGKALLIDPGDEPERILAEVRRLNLEVTEIVCTHAHVDHAGGVARLKRLLGVPFALRPGDRPVLEFMPQAASMFGLPDVEVPEVERALADGDELELGELTARVIHTPGHSPGGCCLYFEAASVVFVGDTLFAGSVGRTDLPGGSTRTLLASILEKLIPLGDDVTAYSGHGPSTTLGHERRSNMFLQAGADRYF